MLSLSATDAARSFSDLLNRVRYQGASFLIERGGEPIARIVPVGPLACTLGELVEVLAQAPRPDETYLEELEARTRAQAPAEGSTWD